MRKQISGLRGQIQGLKGQIQGLRGLISSLRGQISGLRGQILSLRGLGGGTNEQTYKRKSPRVLQDFVVFGAAAQKQKTGIEIANVTHNGLILIRVAAIDTWLVKVVPKSITSHDSDPE